MPRLRCPDSGSADRLTSLPTALQPSPGGHRQITKIRFHRARLRISRRYQRFNGALRQLSVSCRSKQVRFCEGLRAKLWTRTPLDCGLRSLLDGVGVGKLERQRSEVKHKLGDEADPGWLSAKRSSSSVNRKHRKVENAGKRSSTTGRSVFRSGSLRRNSPTHLKLTPLARSQVAVITASSHKVEIHLLH